MNSGSGALVGGVAGSPTITYTLGTGCFTTVTATVNPSPSTISGPASVCVGATINLTDAGGGTWGSSNTNVTVNVSSGVVTGVSPGSATITYTLPTSCAITTNITINTQPAQPSGTASVCVGQNSPLTDAITGGTWASSNTLLATVNGSGAVFGVAAGNPNITYTLSTGCSVSVIETVNPLPSAITGVAPVCVGSTIALTDGGGGIWSSNNTAIATVNSSNGAVTGVLGPNTATITYTLPTSCIITSVVTVNVQPAGITGTTTVVCTGATATIMLGDATSGGAWSSSNTAQATVSPTGGVVGGVAAGIPNITYTLPAGCFTIIPVTVNTSPATITGTLSVCTGLTTVLNDATTGGTWTSGSTTFATIGSNTGIVTGIIAANTSIITYTAPNACFVSIPVTVNQTPAPIGGTLIVCAGSPAFLNDITSGGAWSSSTTSVATVGSTGTVTGVAAGISSIFYTTSVGCNASAVVTVNPIPNISSFTAPTATNVCSGLGSTVTINSTSLGTGTYTVTYNLSAPNIATGLTATLNMGPTNGTFAIPGAALSGIGTTTVTVTSITNSFNCSSNVLANNTVAITTLPLPTVFTVTASNGGAYCAGGIGVHIFLSGSLGSVNYQLYNGATTVGGPLSGTTAGLDFGLQTATGTYTVVATNLSTGCQILMSGSPVVTINPLPAVNNVTGGGGYCFGGVGVHVGLNGSVSGNNYQLYINGVISGSPLSGGGVLDFGLQTAAGTYTIVATNVATGCTSNMSGSATVVINPLPSAISGTTNVCRVQALH